jgi:hypothetical protein
MARWLGTGRGRQLVPEQLQRAWHRAVDRAGDEDPGSPPVAEAPAAPDAGLVVSYTPQDRIDGRPKRGRLPDPDHKGQTSREAPPGWYDGSHEGMFPAQW